MPDHRPMLAQPGGGRPPTGAEWVHEVKWDGVRCILAWDGEAVALTSRTGNQMARKYPEIARAAARLQPGLVLDGEIVTLDEDGIPSFELLQRRMNVHNPTPDLSAAVPITYVVFDVLHRGESLLDVLLEERLDVLASIELPRPFVRSDTFSDPEPLWNFAEERGLEGVVSKRRMSIYRPGFRSPDWIKSTVFKSLRAVVGGFTEGEGGRTGGFGALILGLPDGRTMRWIGSVGSGFSEADVVAIRRALDEMTIAESPFEPGVSMPTGITWVAPALVAVVQYKQWTGAGRLRGPSFKGFSDHPIEEVNWESEGPDSPGG